METYILSLVVELQLMKLKERRALESATRAFVCEGRIDKAILKGRNMYPKAEDESTPLELSPIDRFLLQKFISINEQEPQWEGSDITVSRPDEKKKHYQLYNASSKGVKI